MPSASVGYANLDAKDDKGRDGFVRLHSPGRLLPIVFVPDFMNTRLQDTPTLVTDPLDGTLMWNPTGFPMSFGAETPGAFACDFERLQQVTAELKPDEKYQYNAFIQKRAVMHIKHYYNLVTPIYRDLVLALADNTYLQSPPSATPGDVLPTDGGGLDPAGNPNGRFDDVPVGSLPTVASGRAKAASAVQKKYEDYATTEYPAAKARMVKYNIKPKVYVAGYDWRRDNAQSALRLASIVEEALADTGARKCIIVAHGMGGLVARYYSQMLGGESKISALFLVGSPTLGMPRRTRRSSTASTFPTSKRKSASILTTTITGPPSTTTW
jgi:hypothetical protein